MLRDSGGSSGEALADELVALWGDISAAMGRWLVLLRAFDEEEHWARLGHTSCSEWVAWRCSISPTTAREYVRVAHALAGLPRVEAAFVAGELSYSKVRALSRIGPVDDDSTLLEWARAGTAADLERIVRAYRGVTREDADRAVRRRSLDLIPDDDGSWVLTGRLTAEDGELLHEALAAAREALPAPSDDALDEPGALRADALVWLVETALAHRDAERPAADRCQVVVHVDVEALVTEGEDPGEGPRCELPAAGAIARETARRLCCDASIVTVVEDRVAGGDPLAVGRRTRSIPPAIRRALAARQPTCAFPGCERERWLDAHHVEHWADGGATALDNLVHLCRRHHRHLHEGSCAVRREEATGAWHFTDRDGREIRPAPLPRRDAGVERLRSSGAGEALTPTGGRQPWDLGLAVDGVLRWAA